MANKRLLHCGGLLKSRPKRKATRTEPVPLPLKHRRTRVWPKRLGGGWWVLSAWQFPATVAILIKNIVVQVTAHKSISKPSMWAVGLRLAGGAFLASQLIIKNSNYIPEA